MAERCILEMVPCKYFLLLILQAPAFLLLCAKVMATEATTVVSAFSETNTNQLILDVESALARTQAMQGIIPQWAADEITKKATVEYMSISDVEREYKLVGHRLVARLNVWKKSLDNGAEEYIHFGATTVDILDTVLVLQLKNSVDLLIQDLLDIEGKFLKIAKANLGTFMAGRTRGQHALPVTFGKKVSTWLAENRRNIDRLAHIKTKLNASGILKGAVGTYLGLGQMAFETEALMMAELGLEPPSVADWHGIRDVFAEYGLTLALISKSFGRLGGELILLQMTELGETLEVLDKGDVGSSTMPQKRNPKGPARLVEYSRSIPRYSEIILDDMVNSFERDGPRADHYLKVISIECEKMLADANRLLGQLRINKETMRLNLDMTKGLILSQRLTFFLANKIGKDTANQLMHEVALFAYKNNVSLAEAVRGHKRAAKEFSEGDLESLLKPETYIGLAIEQTEKIIKEIELLRGNP
jgi:adenylosuccinate lyase